jgi:hypothetical protein
MEGKMKYLFVLISLIIFSSGCAGIKEFGKSIAGVSTKALEDDLPNAIIKKIPLDFQTAQKKVTEALGHMGSFIYAKNKYKGMIAFYVSETDTTCVGIFFKALDQANTEIQVTSPSTLAKETIATRLMWRLEEMLGSKKVEVQLNPDESKQEKELETLKEIKQTK